jgi:hypothetical protein
MRLIAPDSGKYAVTVMSLIRGSSKDSLTISNQAQCCCSVISDWSLVM